MKDKIVTAVVLFALMASLSVVQAEEKKKIYKYTDENGVTHYTETKPSEDYEEADLPPLSIVPSTPIKTTTASSTSDEPPQDPSVVESFTLLTPTNEQNLWGTGGKLSASVEPLTPAQQAKYQVQFVVDGKKMKPADGSTQVFEGIYRGEHTVKALLVNRFTQKKIKETKTVTFFMHQNSKK